MESIASGSNSISVTINSSNSIFWTIISGVLIFILGQIFVEAILKPHKRFKELKAKISYSLVLYGNIYSSPLIREMSSVAELGEYEAVGSELRKLASELTGYLEERWSVTGKVNSNNISKAASALIGLSNTLIVSECHVDRARENNSRRVEIIKESLKIQRKIEV